MSAVRCMAIITVILSIVSDCNGFKAKRTYPRRINMIPMDRGCPFPSLFSNIDGKDSEIEQIYSGAEELLNFKEVIQVRNINKIATFEDIFTFVALMPVIITSIYSAATGIFVPEQYLICSICTFLTSIAHLNLSIITPRDIRIPRLADYKTTYEYSFIFLFTFSWALFRLTSYYPLSLQIIDLPMTIITTLLVVYALVFSITGKIQLSKIIKNGIVSESKREKETETLSFSLSSFSTNSLSQELINETQLLLTGNFLLNLLTTLFLPFLWTISLRHSLWWDRIQSLHHHQAALLGLEFLVAIIGNSAGNELLRAYEMKIIPLAVHVFIIGILMNFALVIFPELLFHYQFSEGISYWNFYFE
mmetsp:Transcript_3689/g.3826  ORF Transcript_3689/g.3826 Transcript_3689/m.3826 type:complete len:362 (+) Transcript_3689:181-1266(+)